MILRIDEDKSRFDGDICSIALLFSASSAAVTSGYDDTAVDVAYKEIALPPEIQFESINHAVSGNVDTYTMTETMNASDLYGNYRPDGCSDTVTVAVIFVLDSYNKTINISINVTSEGISILSFNDTLSEDGISEENAWIYSQFVPQIQTRGVDVGVVQDAWRDIQFLSDNIGKAFSDTVKNAIEKVLAKAVVKRIATAAATAIIPGIGWALAIINVGLAAYDLYQLSKELPGLVEMLKVDIAGCIYYDDTKTINVAKRYCGEDNKKISLVSLNGVDFSKKDYGKYYLTYVDKNNNMIYISSVEINKTYATNIMKIESEPSGLSIYTRNMEDAKGVAQDASGNRIPIWHTVKHENVPIGLMHFHHALHDGDKHYPAHAFYGEPI